MLFNKHELVDEFGGKSILGLGAMYETPSAWDDHRMVGAPSGWAETVVEEQFPSLQRAIREAYLVTLVQKNGKTSGIANE